MAHFLKDQRRKALSGKKFGKYLPYALIEMMLVVLGILIALQVDNWNERRIEQNEEIRILEQLVEDFNTNKIILGTYQQEYKRVLKNIDVALRNTGPKAVLPPSLVYDSIANLSTPTVELLHTDAAAEFGMSIEKLSNNQIKLALMAFPASFNQYKELETTLKDLTFQQRKVYQRYIPLIAAEKSYRQELFSSDSLGFLRDRDFQNLSVDRLRNSQNARVQLEWLTEHNDTILRLLNRELDLFKNN